MVTDTTDTIVMTAETRTGTLGVERREEYGSPRRRARVAWELISISPRLTVTLMTYSTKGRAVAALNSEIEWRNS